MKCLHSLIIASIATPLMVFSSASFAHEGSHIFGSWVNRSAPCPIVHSSSDSVYRYVHRDDRTPRPTQSRCYYDVFDEVSPASNHGSGNNNTCQPINIPTGNKYFSLSHFSGQGVSPLAWLLHYNSHQRPRLWFTNYGQQLRISEAYNDRGATVDAVRDDGSAINFQFRDGTVYTESQRRERLTLSSSVYSLRLADNTVETYDLNGRLLSIRYPSGITHKLTYSNNNNTVTISRFNESLVLHLVDGNVVQAVLPDDTTVDYTWDTSGAMDVLTSVTHADSSTRTYLYENTNFPQYITGIIDENGHRIASVAYDSEGRAISSEVGALQTGIDRTDITYHDDGSRTVTNSLGKQNTYHFTQFNGEYKMTQVEGHASANCAAANQAYTYDANGFIASKTDWQGNITTYVHNTRGQEISRTEASSTLTYQMTQVYDELSRVMEMIGADNQVTQYDYDTNNNAVQAINPRQYATQFRYDLLNRLIRTTDPD